MVTVKFKLNWETLQRDSVFDCFGRAGESNCLNPDCCLDSSTSPNKGDAPPARVEHQHHPMEGRGRAEPPQRRVGQQPPLSPPSSLHRKESGKAAPVPWLSLYPASQEPTLEGSGIWVGFGLGSVLPLSFLHAPKGWRYACHSCTP